MAEPTGWAATMTRRHRKTLHQIDAVVRHLHGATSERRMVVRAVTAARAGDYAAARRYLAKASRAVRAEPDPEVTASCSSSLRFRDGAWEWISP